MRGDRLNAALVDRIRSSVHTLTVIYPVARPVMAGTPPVASAPLSPLTGPAITQVVFPTAAVPDRPSVTLRCLWLDSYTSRMVNSEPIRRNRIGWREGATAVARVLVSDAALTSDPWGDTVFTGAEIVEHGGHRYRVDAIDAVGSSFSAPLTYHVWLFGAVKQ